MSDIDADYIDTLLVANATQEQREYLIEKGFDADSIVMATRSRWLPLALAASNHQADLLFAVGFMTGMEAALRAMDRKEMEEKFDA